MLPSHRLDRRPPLPVFRPARPPVGLARVSRSGRASRRAPAGGAAHLRLPTQLLHGAAGASAYASGSGDLPHGCQSRKTRPVPLRPDCAAGAGSRCRAANSPAAPRRSPPATTTSPIPNALRFPSIRCWIGRSAIATAASKPWRPKPRQDRGQSRTITPQLADLIERLKRENPHRTGTTLLRELALSSGQNAAGDLRLHAVPLPQTARPLRTATARSRRRTRSSKPNTATRSGSPTCSSAPTSSAPAAARCRPFCTPPSMTPAGSSRTPSSIPARDWMPAWTACARPSPPAACPCGSTWTTPRSIAASNWRASPPRSAF